MQPKLRIKDNTYQKLTVLYILIFLYAQLTANAQPAHSDSSNYDYAKINSLALDADVATVMQLLNVPYNKTLTQKAEKVKQQYEKRFLSDNQPNDYLIERKSSLDGLLMIYVNYWKVALLKPKENFDSSLISSVTDFLAKEFQIEKAVAADSIQVLLKRFVEKAGYKTTGLGRTGKLLDLLIWKEQLDTTYSFILNKEAIRPKVVFMDDFLTLGWEEFATFGRSYPGGWATKDAIYCVRKAYNLNSENFQISYLAHEGNHFKDQQQFPLLSSTDLEYRAKLTELSLAKETIYNIITGFIRNANAKSENAHSLANYYVIRDLSKALFKNDFVSEESKWKEINRQTINKRAAKLYKKNTKALKEKGASIERYIM